MLTTFDKAIVAFLISGLGLAAFKLPLLADPAVQQGVIAIATPVIIALGTYFVPNKVALADPINATVAVVQK